MEKITLISLKEHRMSLLVTSSFIDAVEWLEKAPPSWKERAFQGLMDQISRKPWDKPNPDVERGMKFEQTVYDCIEKKKHLDPTFKCSDEFKEFITECDGGQFQRKAKRFDVIDGKEFCLYGKVDVMFPDKIIDIKACASYGGSSKYLGKSQHLLYLFITEKTDFVYLVAEFGEIPNMKIKRVFRALYTVESRDTLKEEVYARIRKAVGFVEQDKELWKLYSTVFSRY